MATATPKALTEEEILKLVKKYIEDNPTGGGGGGGGAVVSADLRTTDDGTYIIVEHIATGIQLFKTKKSDLLFCAPGGMIYNEP